MFFFSFIPKLINFVDREKNRIATRSGRESTESSDGRGYNLIPSDINVCWNRLFHANEESPEEYSVHFLK